MEVISVTSPEGIVIETLPDGVTMTQDKRLCNISFNGLSSLQGEWEITIKSVGSGNGMETTKTFTVKLGILDSINKIDAVESDDSGVTYDIGGRKISEPTQRGIYIRKGKKVVIK